MTDRTSAVVLAGGRGRRFGGQDKGLLDCNGRPLIEYVIALLRPQVDEIIISANRNLDRYRPLADLVVEDGIDGYAGPLAGLAAGLHAARHDLVMVAPCDTPLLPGNLVQDLADSLTDEDEACVVHDGQRLQPLVGIYRRHLADAVAACLAGGNRRVDAWLAGIGHSTLHHPAGAGRFTNVNTESGLQDACARLARA